MFKRPAAEAPPAPNPVPVKKKAPATPARLDLPVWENETMEGVFGVTLSVRVIPGVYRC